MSEADTTVRVEQWSGAHDVPKAGRSGFTVVDGRQVHYLEWGPSGAPTVLAMHGGGQTAYMFEDIGAQAARPLHVIAIDLPGHGESGSLDGTEGVSPAGASGDRSRRCSTEFGVAPVAIIGASLGGIIAHDAWRRRDPSSSRRSR